MGRNIKKLHNAKINNMNNNAKDDFYTQYEDIELELNNYNFENMTVYCNCDNPFKSNFFRYFDNNFEKLKLKKLICTFYNKDDIGYGLEVKVIDERKTYTEIIMDDDGDFRKESSIKFLKECDIIVTNPPFSLFREFVEQLIKYNKKFIIIGNQNAITYNNIFSLIKDGKLFLGATYKCQNKFEVPAEYPITTKSHIMDEYGKHYITIAGVRWFTNIKSFNNKPFIELTKKYNENDYPTYDNYDAINVNKTKDIPYDYNGVIGVPITFMDYWNPEQFEIVGLGKSRVNFNPTKKYKNIVYIKKDGTKIKKSEIVTLTLRHDEKPDGSYYICDNCDYYLTIPYCRILIKRK